MCCPIFILTNRIDALVSFLTLHSTERIIGHNNDFWGKTMLNAIQNMNSDSVSTIRNLTLNISTHYCPLSISRNSNITVKLKIFTKLNSSNSEDGSCIKIIKFPNIFHNRMHILICGVCEYI